MSLRKLSPGDGDAYLTRQVAAHDTAVPAGGLGAYYAERLDALREDARVARSLHDAPAPVIRLP
jgi:hypothetical protein